jgi:hypothetical protein
MTPQFFSHRRIPIMVYSVIITVAILLRTYRPGLRRTHWDELNIMFWSNRIARHGDFIWVSNNDVAGTLPFDLLTRYSAISNYTAAFPYLFTENPLVVRAFVGLLGGLSIIWVMLAAKRSGHVAAVVAGVWASVTMIAVDAARRVINPNLGLFFMGLWMYTGLVGYRNNQRWLIISHWALLAIITQYQVSSALLGAATLVLAGAHLAANRQRVRAVLTSTGAGVLTAILITLAWLIADWAPDPPGLMPWERSENTANLTEPRPITQRLSDTFVWFSDTTVSSHYREFERGFAGAEAFFPPASVDWLLMGLAGLWFVAWGWYIRRPGTRLVAAYFGAIVLVPLVGAQLTVPGAMRHHYFFGATYGFFPIVGMAAADLYRYQRGKIAVITVTAVYVAIQLWLASGVVRWTNAYGWYEAFNAPMGTYHNLVDTWTQDHDTVLVIEQGRPETQRYFWTVVRGNADLRLINAISNTEGIPISADGTQVVGLSDSAVIPRLNRPIERIGNSADLDTPVFQHVLLTPTDLPPMTFMVEDFAASYRYANGVQLVGAYLEGTPQPRSEVPLTLVWRPGEKVPTENYAFSARLIAKDGTPYGVQDFRSLDRNHWRFGEWVINPITIPLGDTYQPTDLLQVIMYREQDGASVDVVDDTGAVVAPWFVLRAGPQ